MGRYSRSRKVHEKKKDKAAPPRERFEEEDGGGSLMSMRDGFKSIAGGSEQPAKSGVSSIVSWVIFALLALALVMFFLGGK